MWLDQFDLIVTADHDRLRRQRRQSPRGGLNRVTPARLAAAAAAIAPRIAALPRPRLAVLLGGPNKAYRFDPAFASTIGDRLARIARESGGSL